MQTGGRPGRGLDVKNCEKSSTFSKARGKKMAVWGAGARGGEDVKFSVPGGDLLPHYVASSGTQNVRSPRASRDVSRAAAGRAARRAIDLEAHQAELAHARGCSRAQIACQLARTPDLTSQPTVALGCCRPIRSARTVPGSGRILLSSGQAMSQVVPPARPSYLVSVWGPSACARQRK